MNKSKVAIVISQIIEKIQIILGALCAFVFILCAISFMFDETVDDVGLIICSWVLGILGILAVLCGLKRKKMRLEFKKYVAKLSVDPTGSLENIASSTGTSVDVVKNNLDFMIKKGFFTNAHVDLQKNQLVIPSMAQKVQGEYNGSSSLNNANSTQLELVTCNCPNCGGINKIAKGTVAECDFCGSPLQG